MQFFTKKCELSVKKLTPKHFQPASIVFIFVERFDKVVDEINASADNPWEHVSLSKGFATYDPAGDNIVQKTMQRADMLMYENKRERKKCRET